jgi:hypothetical protein
MDKQMSLTTSTTAPSPATLVYPEIAASDLEAARRFLFGDGARTVVRPRTGKPFQEKAPTCHLGIARARLRSVKATG